MNHSFVDAFIEYLTKRAITCNAAAVDNVRDGTITNPTEGILVFPIMYRVIHGARFDRTWLTCFLTLAPTRCQRSRIALFELAAATTTKCRGNHMDQFGGLLLALEIASIEQSRQFKIQFFKSVIIISLRCCGQYVLVLQISGSCKYCGNWSTVARESIRTLLGPFYEHKDGCYVKHFEVLLAAKRESQLSWLC